MKLYTWNFLFYLIQCTNNANQLIKFRKIHCFFYHKEYFSLPEHLHSSKDLFKINKKLVFPHFLKKNYISFNHNI